MKSVLVNLEDVISSISAALDLIDPRLVHHQKTVAYITKFLADELDIQGREKRSAVLGAVLHDIGAPSIAERVSLLGDENDAVHWHAEVGFHLLSQFKNFDDVAKVVRFHHWPWNGGKGATCDREEVPLASHIVHLADRIDTKIDPMKNILGQAQEIRNYITDNKQTLFQPNVVAAFLRLADKECFWLDIMSVKKSGVLNHKDHYLDYLTEPVELAELAKTLSLIIDSRSRFTAFHSACVAATAETMARLIGFPECEVFEVRIAGFLHDIGKLAVPQEILEKNGRLTEAEYDVIRSHPYYTYKILDCIDGIGSIKTWAAYHHEKPDCTGYPFHFGASELPTGARIITFTDIFSALAEDRPYRSALPREKIMQIVAQETRGSSLDAKLLKIMDESYDLFEGVLRETQEELSRDLAGFWRFSRIMAA